MDARRRFEELDWRETPMGAISLRRRVEPTLGIDVYEVKLDDDFLMSSLFTVAEVELATLSLAAVGSDHLDVVVGGLGLGFTAQAVLADDRVRSLHVVEALEDVIGWHERALLPLGAELTGDARCQLVPGDFFALVRDPQRWSEQLPARCDAVLVDIDHSPTRVLHPSHASFYTPAGMRGVLGRLRPGGVFGLWSDDPPSEAFVAVLGSVFTSVVAHVVRFANPLTGGSSSNTVYVAVAPG